ncbi:MAG: FKBP-type peptidyl-prolyl cis-trans isomerase, partial [Bacteroidales bacterium]
IWTNDIDSTNRNSLSFGDTILISLQGYYVEADTSYINSFPGRQFFPIGNSGDSIRYIYGEEFFPVTLAVNEVVQYMQLNVPVEFVCSSEYGYGENGFRHPYTGEFIILPDMPLHYKVELLDTVSIGN